jgi:hypothetical protein
MKHKNIKYIALAIALTSQLSNEQQKENLQNNLSRKEIFKLFYDSNRFLANF